MLNERLKHFKLGEIDLRCLNERVSLDIKPILVVMNDGNFKGYDKVLPKTNLTTNDGKEIPRNHKIHRRRKQRLHKIISSFKKRIA